MHPRTAVISRSCENAPFLAEAGQFLAFRGREAGPPCIQFARARFTHARNARLGQVEIAGGCADRLAFVKHLRLP